LTADTPFYCRICNRRSQRRSEYTWISARKDLLDLERKDDRENRECAYLQKRYLVSPDESDAGVVVTRRSTFDLCAVGLRSSREDREKNCERKSRRRVGRVERPTRYLDLRFPFARDFRGHEGPKLSRPGGSGGSRAPPGPGRDARQGHGAALRGQLAGVRGQLDQQRQRQNFRPATGRRDPQATLRRRGGVAVRGRVGGSEQRAVIDEGG